MRLNTLLRLVFCSLIATAQDPYDSDLVLSHLLNQMEALENKCKDRVLFDAMWRELNIKVETDTKKTISSFHLCQIYHQLQASIFQEADFFHFHLGSLCNSCDVSFYEFVAVWCGKCCIGNGE